ncbi:MAG: hypothetical protein Q7R35_08640 [Elusimicrobiota bacterium]|nr:hypothetical protein [Elusimicrobiota bacterium]
MTFCHALKLPAPTFIRNDFRELSCDDAMLAIAQLKQYSAECGKEAPAV